MNEWVKVSERTPAVRQHTIWTWNGKSVGSIDSTARMTAAEFAEFYPDVTHWMLKEPPKPPEPPRDSRFANEKIPASPIKD